jgi:hypothetical protein
VNPPFGLILSHMTTVYSLILKLFSINFNIIPRQYLSLPRGSSSLRFSNENILVCISTQIYTRPLTSLSFDKWYFVNSKIFDSLSSV